MDKLIIILGAWLAEVLGTRHKMGTKILNSY